jgi:catechol 2,3-dioxygenase-like lactoylglutathione lyase family enzyme
MRVEHVVPILNVSDVTESQAWFGKLGWERGFEWRGSDEGRADQRADKGTWISVWVDDVDAVHERATTNGLEVTFPPTDEPWNVRECHVRHPDGHVLRIGRAR